MASVRVGISGWTYTPWRGNFYPKGLPQKLELAYASRRFNALEINGTFYSLQRPSSFQTWYNATPPDFVFTLKGGRYITHMRKLNDVKLPLANFFASGVLNLREKLGPILWQFPPFVRFDEARFAAFFEQLPHDTHELARLARSHGDFLKGRVMLNADAKREVRHAVEFRHESFLTDRFVELLRAHNIAIIVADVAGKFPTAQDVTADWVYVRLHGSRKLYVSGYSPREIRTWAQRIQAWRDGREPADARRITTRPTEPRQGGRDVFVFFDNTDVKLRAPVDARRMASTLGIGDTSTPSQVLKTLGVSASKARRAAHAGARK